MSDLPIYEPMLATRWPAAFSDPAWAFEVKWDGVRAIAAWDGVGLDLRSRTGRAIGKTYPDLGHLAGLPPCVLDGEIVAFDEEGRPSFGRLQTRMNLRTAAGSEVETPVSFMAFDLLYWEVPLVDQPWRSRRDQLSQLELPLPYLIPEPVIGDGEALWAGVADQRLEGMVGKRLDSAYRPGTRSADWRKIARVDQVRAVVGGYLPGEGSRASTFGSLLLGLIDEDGLRYIGSVGTGFSGATLRAIRAALDESETEEPAFRDGADIPARAVFVEPSLIALVEFKEWTRAGKLRAPSFKGFTDDDWQAITWGAEGPPAPKTGSG